MNHFFTTFFIDDDFGCFGNVSLETSAVFFLLSLMFLLIFRRFVRKMGQLGKKIYQKILLFQLRHKKDSISVIRSSKNTQLRFNQIFTAHFSVEAIIFELIEKSMSPHPDRCASAPN